MKHLIYAFIAYVLVTHVSGEVTPVPETDVDDCGSFICDESAGDDCSDTADLSAGLAVLDACTPTTGYCELIRKRNSDGTFSYVGNCSSTCTSETYDDSVSDTVSLCCRGLSCNLDGSSLPTDCTGDPLPIVTHGSYMSTGETFGDIANPSCDTGYKLSGAEIVCQGNGRWSTSTASCNRITCVNDPLPSISNGAYSAPSKNSGDTATLQCDSDYKVSGNDSIECQEDETWTTSTSTCEMRTCVNDPLPPVPNGAYSAASKNSGDIATLQCDSDYKVIGTGIIECQTDETWTTSASTCERKTCGTLPSLTDGEFSAASQFMGDTATASCDTGYKLTGSTTIECLANEAWSESQVICTRITCIDDPLPTVSHGTYSAASKNSGDTATLECDSDYKVIGTGILECQTDETWTTSASTCERKTCGTLPSLTDGEFSAASQFVGDTATASCDTGYKLTGSTTIECLANEAWSESQVICTRITCVNDPLPSISNGAYSAPSKHSGDIATLQCDSDYKVSGTETIECQEDETWTTSTSTCERRSCIDDPLPTVSHGTYSAASKNSGDTATLQCDSDYKVIGTGILECQTDETWTTSASTCERKTCGTLPSLTDGEFSAASQFVGDTATASCDTGYKLTGSTTIECLANETWSESQANCTRISCEKDPLPPIENGTFSASSKNMGDKATLTCDSGYYVNGSNEIECQSTSLWTEPSATCEIATDCEHDPLPSISNGTYSATTKNFGDTATATCNQGYTLSSTTNTVECKIDGTWSTATATCSETV